MHGLGDVQALLRREIVEGEEAPTAALQDQLVDPDHVRIHRNHFYTTLSAALATTYPVIGKLVGDRFFDHAARSFVRGCPPSRPCLFEYGEEFGDFLDAFEPARGLPYLGDVARLEWAMNACHHAVDLPPVDNREIAGLAQDIYPELRFELHPSVRLLASAYPIDAIWRINQPGAAEETVDLGSGGVTLLIRRDGEQVEFSHLSPSWDAFLRALAAGETLAAAFERANAAEAAFDLSVALARLLALGLFGAVRLPDVDKGGENG
jgi:hypothetical protein